MQDDEVGRREKVIRDVGRTVTDAVIRGADAAESVAENLKETIKSKTSGERQNRDNVVMGRVDKESLKRRPASLPRESKHGKVFLTPYPSR